MNRHRLSPTAFALAAVVAGYAVPAVGHAQSVDASEFAKLKAQVDAQAQQIAKQQSEIDRLKAEQTDSLGAIRAGAIAPVAHRAFAEAEYTAPAGGSGASSPPFSAVGERPAEQQRQIAAIPPQLGVLTPGGHLILDPSVEYDRTSNDRLVFRGVVIVPGINLGEVEANRAARDTAVTTAAFRYGITNRLEVEARVPYVYRHDTVTTVAAQSNNFQQHSSIYGRGLGDVEFAARYQLNDGRGGWPIFVATSRFKPPTGHGPYDVAYDADAVATELPTGSGFWGVEGGVTMLYPSDPAIVFGSLTYLHNFSRDVDKDFGSGASVLHVGEVRPGDSIGATLGFGLSLNPKLSVSFGYSHNYIFKTVAFENSPGKEPIMSSSQPLVAGSLLMGWSFRLTDRVTLNNSFQFGVTSDAPDLQVIFRVPYRF